jgi:hypothetical protein
MQKNRVYIRVNALKFFCSRNYLIINDNIFQDLQKTAKCCFVTACISIIYNFNALTLSGKYVFAQILSFVDKYELNKCVKRHKGNRHNRGFDCWNQFVQLLFGQLAALNSLRSISLCLRAHRHQLYHFGIKKWADASVLSRANEKRGSQIFADYGAYLIALVRPLYAACPLESLDTENDIFALDSTPISVSINLCTWADGKYSRGAVKMHTLLNLRGSITEFILITDGKYHDSNALDIIPFYANTIYLMDKEYVDFEALFRLNNASAFL